MAYAAGSQQVTGRGTARQNGSKAWNDTTELRRSDGLLSLAVSDKQTTIGQHVEPNLSRPTTWIQISACAKSYIFGWTLDSVDVTRGYNKRLSYRRETRATLIIS